MKHRTLLTPKQLAEINKNLKLKHGMHSDGRPKWRLILNTPQYTEKRYAEVWKYDEHDNYVGIEEGVQELPKYGYIPDYIYILEQLDIRDWRTLPKELGMVHDNRNGIYEPRWPFMTKDFEYLIPTLEGCEFIIECIRITTNKKKNVNIPKPKDIINKRRDKFMEEFKEIEPAFDGKKHTDMYPNKPFTGVESSGQSSSETPIINSSNGASK